MDVYIFFALEGALLEGTCGRHISVIQHSGIIMTANYPGVPQCNCSISYNTPLEHQEVNLTLLDRIVSFYDRISVCGNILYVHSKIKHYPTNQCTRYQLYQWQIRLLSWVFPSTFNIVINVDAPRGLMFEYKGKPYILFYFN